MHETDYYQLSIHLWASGNHWFSGSILQRFNKAYLVTTLFAILTAIGWYIANAMPSYGSELHGILAIQTTVVFVSSLLTGLILRLKKKRIS